MNEYSKRNQEIGDAIAQAKRKLLDASKAGADLPNAVEEFCSQLGTKLISIVGPPEDDEELKAYQNVVLRKIAERNGKQPDEREIPGPEQLTSNLQASRDARDKDCRSFEELAGHKLMTLSMIAGKFWQDLQDAEKNFEFYDHQYGGESGPLTGDEVDHLTKQILGDGEEEASGPLMLLADEIDRRRNDSSLIRQLAETIRTTARESFFKYQSNADDQEVERLREAVRCAAAGGAH